MFVIMNFTDRQFGLMEVFNSTQKELPPEPIQQLELFWIKPKPSKGFEPLEGIYLKDYSFLSRAICS